MYSYSLGFLISLQTQAYRIQTVSMYTHLDTYIYPYKYTEYLCIRAYVKYIYIYICVCIHTYMYIYLFMCIYIYAHTHPTYTHIYMHVCTCVYIYTCKYIGTHKHVDTCVCIWSLERTPRMSPRSRHLCIGRLYPAAYLLRKQKKYFGFSDSQIWFFLKREVPSNLDS